MGKLSNLFKYKKKIEIKDPKTDKVVNVAWVRVLGDDDLKKAYQWARIASSEKRANLRDTNSVEHKDEIAQLDGVPKENLVGIILAAREQEFSNQASMAIVRPELPTLDEITERPDAPSLEDQERLDRLVKETDEGYEKAIKDYIDTKVEEVGAELMERPLPEVLELAKSDLANIQALDAFVSELNDQKGYRGTYDDEECRVRSFDSIEDFKSQHTLLKTQIITAYLDMEMGADDVKK